jgi:hypothetical protein
MVSFEEIPEKKDGASSTAEEILKKETGDVDVDDSWEELMGKDLIMKVGAVQCLSYSSFQCSVVHIQCIS